MKTFRIFLSLCVTALMLAAGAHEAQAGGIVIYGRAQSTVGLTTATPTTPVNIGDLGPAPAQLSPVEQQLYLIASLVFGGHDAVLERSDEGGSTATSAVLDGDLEAQGGCTAGGATSLSSLLVLALLTRRFARRRA